MASVINQIKLGTTEYAIAASAYAECNTDETTMGKTATICTNGDTTNTAFTLVKGVAVQVKFVNANYSASAISLNVNNTGDKAIYYRGAAFANASAIKAGSIHTFVYDGTYWQLVGDLDTNTNTQRAYYTSNPAMNGTASAGSSTSVSRGDHVHPTDTSRASSTHTHGNIANDGTLATASRVVITDTNKKVTTSSSITTTELGYLDGVTSNIQTQLDGKAASSHGTHVTYATAAGKANGTAAVGTSSKVAREDHVHPTDTSRAPTNHASASNTYGLGTVTNYGHVKISNGDVYTVAASDGYAAGMDHTHSNYVAKDAAGGIQVTQVATNTIYSQGYLSVHTADGSINLTATDSADDDKARVQLKSDVVEISKVEPVNDEDSSHIMLYDDQLDISVRGQANTTEDYDSEITSGISISSHQVTIGDINAADNDPEYDQMEVNIDANRVNLNATYAQVNQAKIMTADDFIFDSSTGILTIKTVWGD